MFKPAGCSYKTIVGKGNLRNRFERLEVVELHDEALNACGSSSNT
jgi:hypothetical protein